MASKSRLAKVSLPTDIPEAELVQWSCREGYVYVPIPPAGSAGHRADKWDVDKWFKALKVELVASGDTMTVRLSDQETAELFAECPLPSDGTPLTTAVEPVIDSSRYFVLRVVDKETGKHAFIGLGFRERSDASGFTTGLDEYRKYLRRKQEADVMKADFESRENGEGGPQRDYSLKANIVIPLKIGTTKRQDGDAAGASTSGSRAGSAVVQGVGALKLAPPPSAPKPVGGGAAGAAPSAGAAEGTPGQASAANTAAAQPAQDNDDGWGDFTSSSGAS
ncbi:hypothetical protein PLESTB_000206300 [Pleodorina starrii]|uniref:NECAP PHear domain-containing protein n=1 Tax=Pleodorina starrii TaxID=330485 RepID=A0A9W6EYA5_9CHLO|nr:hypothetical protein PLESTM_000325200 [Pleodorina starrii]GLC49319.1 hypothetical protein PLESTB_000206300 [Pleodorina starrii]GLC73424.1 hypothetical protein PLESTF_001373900 [Pleodorina starrii]